MLDVSYLESAAAASERRYAKLARMRSAGTLGGASVKAGKVRFGLPMLPWLGGAGPLAWRQLTAATRSYRALTILLIAGAVGGIGPALATASDDSGAEVLPWMLTGMGLFMSLMLSQFFAYDFRADVDRIEVLKTLPVSAWKIVAGQLVPPVVMCKRVPGTDRRVGLHVSRQGRLPVAGCCPVRTAVEPVAHGRGKRHLPAVSDAAGADDAGRPVPGRRQVLVMLGKMLLGSARASGLWPALRPTGLRAKLDRRGARRVAGRGRTGAGPGRSWRWRSATSTCAGDTRREVRWIKQ